MNKTRQIILHLVTWVSILLFFLVLGSEGVSIKYQLVVAIVYFGIINIAVFYINYLYLLPDVLSRKTYLKYFLSLLFLLLLSGFVKYGLASYFSEYILHHAETERTLTFFEYYAGAVSVSLFFIFLSSGVRFAVDWFINEKVRKDLEKEKLLAELAFLRSQINPHFLFNSLNNIYSLAYQKSDKAPEAILKLSEIMRYMLNDTNETEVALSKEIGYLENYIELQKLRFKDQAYIEFHLKNDEYFEGKVPPFILIAFVENAFKHGDVNDPLKPIKICCEVNDEILHFMVSNKKSKHNKDDIGGIGMNNVRRRLDLLYGDKYSLKILNNDDSYSCELSLVL